ncbi:hypothetical protein FJT64_022375 [Amphibalanus amphitrite]|uniref:Glycosyltransferase family 92 protein n=1 Tax=Amphibalanus amphitrite TaxID=1232801 RepID=A0A6A4WQL7_AMPAM|nr:hypothetical protein FJT64_022375 [Amphibalanus amphitrite]
MEVLKEQATQEAKLQELIKEMEFNKQQGLLMAQLAEEEAQQQVYEQCGRSEVLDTFGSPSSATVAPPTDDLAWDGDSWQQVTPTLFIFSSYVSHGSGVVTLAAAIGQPTADQLSCWVWVEGAGAAAGTVSLQRLPAEPDAPFAGWRLVCAFDGYRAPYAVGYRARSAAGRQPAVSAVGRRDWPGPRGQLGACLIPSDWASGDVDRLAEFAAFHAAVGLSRLWVYDPAPGRAVSQLLLRAAGALPTRLVRWDFPLRLETPVAQRTAADLLRRDCMVRTSGRVEHVLALNVTQLVVPRRHDTIQEMVRATEEQMRRPGAASFSLSQEWFCTDAKDGPYAHKPPELTLSSKTSLLSERTVRGAVRLVRPEAVADPVSAGAWTTPDERPPQLNPLVAAVHLYIDCGAEAAAQATAFEGAAVRFKTRLVNAPLFVSYKQIRDATLRGDPPAKTNGTHHAEPPLPLPVGGR